MYPSVRPFVTSVVRLIPGIPNCIAGPLPWPATPWHTEQLIWKYLRPFSSEASPIGVGFAIAAQESGNAVYETWKPAMYVPFVGTENCGFPRDGVSESFTGSHVQREGWRLKSVNHSHPLKIRSGSESARTRSLAFTSHLRCAMTTQQRRRFLRLVRCAFQPQTVITAAEPRVVADRHRQSGDA